MSINNLQADHKVSRRREVMMKKTSLSSSIDSFFSKPTRKESEPIQKTNRIIMNDDDGENECFDDNTAAMGTPLSAIAEAFEELSGFLIKSNEGGSFCVEEDIRLKPFCEACSHVSTLFRCLGIAFKFAEMEYVAKVRDLTEASKRYGTLNHILDFDVRNDSVRTQGSLSRNLRRVRLGLDLIRGLFQNFLSPDECSLKEAASASYAKVCAPFHTWAVRTAVSAGMCALPTREQLLLKLNETGESAAKEMKRYIDASLPVIEYIDKLYISRNISLDW